VRPTRPLRVLLALGLAAGTLAPALLEAQAGSAPARHNVRSRSLAIRNATIVDGNGTPARGPADILIVNDTIAQIVWLDPVALRAGRARRPQAE